MNESGGLDDSETQEQEDRLEIGAPPSGTAKVSKEGERVLEFNDVILLQVTIEADVVREKDEDEKDKVNSLLNVENTQSTILSFPLFRCRLLPDASAKGTKERFQE